MKKSLEDRVEYLEGKVAQLEKKLQSYEFHSIEKRVEQQRHVQSETVEHAAPSQQTKRKEKTATQRKPIEWEILIFQKILPRVFILILILGVLWGLKAAYDYGFITVQVILTLAILLSIIMTVIGLIQMKKERRILGQVLIGGAIPIFMLTIFSMHQIYEMISSTPAFLFNIVAIIAGIVFTTIFRSQSIGIISLIGGLLIPYLIESTEPNYYFFVSYEGLLYLLFLVLALYLNFQLLYITSAIFLHVAILGIFIFSSIPDSFTLLIVSPIIIQQLALFVGLIVTKISLKIQAYTLLASLLISSIWIFAQLEQVEQIIIFIGLAVLYAIGYYFYKKDNTRAAIFVVNGSLAILFAFLAYESDVIYEVLLAIIVIYVFYAQKFKTTIHYLLALILYFIAFVSFNTFYLEQLFSFEMLHKIMFLIVTVFLLYFFVNSAKESKTQRLMTNFGLPYLAFLLLFFTSDVTYFITSEWTIYDYDPLILSSFWVVIAIAFMIVGRFPLLTAGKFTGVAILFFTVAKVILVDISFMDITIRAILFIGLGLIGLLISRVYYKNNDKKD